MNRPDKVLIIAEAGVNHNGQRDIALSLVDAAAAAGADIVKFQSFNAAALASQFAPKAAYQNITTDAAESQLAMLKKLELAPELALELADYARSKGLEFLSTPFDIPSVEFLAGMRPRRWKIPSGEITNLPYLRTVGAQGGAQGGEVILSTGMSDLEEIAAALAVLESAGTPQSRVILLHCTTEYPAPFADVNLRALRTMREAFPACRGIGYSDHTPGIEISLAAVALGAVVIEKHFTLDRGMEGPDHQASLEPDELRALVRGIRHIEAAMGDGVKSARPSELPNRDIARKSLVAARPIKAGELLTEDNLTVKRPGTGLSPMLWDSILGTRAERDLQTDELL